MKMNSKRLIVFQVAIYFVAMFVTGFLFDLLFTYLDVWGNVFVSFFCAITVVPLIHELGHREIFIKDEDVQKVEENLLQKGYTKTDESETKRIYLRKQNWIYWKKVILKEKVNCFSLKFPYGSEFDYFKKYRHI